LKTDVHLTFPEVEFVLLIGVTFPLFNFRENYFFANFKLVVVLIAVVCSYCY